MAQRGQSDDGVGCAVVLVLAVALAIVYFAATWPYYLGVWVAEKAGAADPSDARTIVGVLFEAGYILSVLSVIAGLLLRRLGLQRHAAAAEAKNAYRRRREAEVARWEAVVRRQEDALATIDRLVDVMTRYPTGTDATTFPGWPGELGRGERVLGFGTAWYSAPRVAHRGGPKVQTEVEAGRYLITDRHIRFHGDSRTEAWAVDRIGGVERETTAQRTRFLFMLMGRKTLTGLTVPAATPSDVLEAHLDWARGHPQPPRSAVVKLQTVREEAARELANVQQQLDRARSQDSGATAPARTS